MPNFNVAEYETVDERIEKFWVKYPEGAIRTEIVSQPLDFERCRFWAAVYANRTDSHPIATGYAFEIAGSSPVNRTNHEENCETSAIGRALANAGFATRGKRPSREEMGKAQRGEQQWARPETRPMRDDDDDEPPVATPAQFDDIAALMRALRMGTTYQENFAIKYVGRKVGPGLLHAQAHELITILQERQNKDLGIDQVSIGSAGNDQYTNAGA